MRISDVCPHHREHGVIIKRLGEDVEVLFKAKDTHHEAIYELRSDCKEMKKSQDEVFRRLKDRDEELKVLSDLTYGVTNLGEKMTKVLEVQDIHTKEISEIKRKPGEVALSIWKLLLSTVVTVTIGIYVGMMLK